MSRHDVSRRRAARHPVGPPGFGYFGNGSSLDSPTIGDIVGLNCNWAGPGARDHHWVGGEPVVDTENVQAQTMARDSADLTVEAELDRHLDQLDASCSTARSARAPRQRR